MLRYRKYVTDKENINIAIKKVFLRDPLIDIFTLKLDLSLKVKDKVISIAHIVNGNHYCCRRIGSHVFSIEMRNCE